MIRVGLISNPRSQRNKRGFEAIRAVVAGAPEVLHESLSEGAEVGEILAEFARREVGVVALNGGDGTAQRVLTALFERRPFERPPPLAVLPRGMANMTAADVGLRGRPADALGRLLAAARAGALEPHLCGRDLLRVEHIRGGAGPQRGMFFGAAGIYDAIMVACNQLHPLGLKGEWAHVLTLLALLADLLLGRRRAIRGHDLGLALDGERLGRRRYLLVFATTLDRLVLGSRPFWNKASGPIRFTSVSDPPRRLLASAPDVLYGSDRRHLPVECYFSRGARRIELEMDGPFTIDGELLEPTPGRPLVLTAADRAEFVRL